MRRLDLTFSALLVPLDYLAILAAGATAFSLRTSRTFIEIRPILQSIPVSQYVAASFVFAAIWVILFAIAGLYRIKTRAAWNELGRIILACTAGIMIVIVTIFFRREITASRFIVLAVWPISILYVSFFRVILGAIRRALLARGYGHQTIVVIGQDRAAQDLITLYKQSPILGYTVLKTFRSWNASVEMEIARLAKEHRIDGLLLADSDLSKEESSAVIHLAQEHHLTFRYLADVFAASINHIDISTVGGIPVIEVKRTPLDGWGRITKRAFDMLIAIIVIILTSPLTILASIIILLQDGFPIIFLNERIGEHGKPFNTYKLRSMWKKDCIGPQFEKNNKKNIEREKELIQERGIKTGPIYKINDDPRHMPFGKWIRRWSIDELPQLFNVLNGTMSIVGPRPHQPREVEKYLSSHRRVFMIKPGITGMAQISGRSDLTFEDENRLDIWYIEHWSLWLDLYILLKTPFAVLLRKGAY